MFRFNRHPSVPLHRNEGLSPIFIVGSGRSGNTLLRRLLMTEAKIYIPPETYVLGDTIRLFPRICKLPWSKIVNLVLSQFEYHQEFRHFPIDSLRPLALELREVQPEERSLARLVDGLYRFLGASSQIPFVCWGDKTPYNTFWLTEISSVFPKARYLKTQRDGCDVVASLLRAGLFSNVEEAAKRWFSACTAADRCGIRIWF